MIKELLVLHHSHIDIGYTHPQPVVWELHRRSIDEAIALCEATADWPEPCRMKWTCEVTSVMLHWLKSASPEQLERLRRLVQHGQFSLGAMWAHWTALVPEDLLIESLQPVRQLRELLGAPCGIAMQTDVNGIPWPVTDLLLDAGIDKLIMSVNIHMGGFPLTRPTVFRWLTPGGRAITVFSGEHYNAFTRETGLREADFTLERMEQGLSSYFQRLRQKGWTHDFAILTATHPAMDDNNPPDPELPGLIRRWNESGRSPAIRLVTSEQLFAKIGELDPRQLPEHAGDWTDFWSNGVGASALDIVISRRAHGALWSARALSTRLPLAGGEAERLAAAVQQLHLANEHTWNVFSSTAALGCGGSGRFEPVPEAEQRIQKAASGATALSLSRLLRRDFLDRLADNPDQSRTNDGLLLFNPSETTRRVCLCLPNELLAGRYPLINGTKHRLDVSEDLLANTPATTWVGPVDLPPLSLRTVRLVDLVKAGSGGVSQWPGCIESAAWRLCYDAETGVIRSLRHLPSDHECLDATAGWDLFGAVQETVARRSVRSHEVNDPRYDYFAVSDSDFDNIIHSDVGGWVRDWKARHRHPVGPVRLAIRSDGEGIHLDRWFAMPGVAGEMQQTISLLADEPRVRFEAYFNKADGLAPESLYFAFPFNMPEAIASFDTAGGAVDFDREQLPGACRDWFTAGSYVAVSGQPGRLVLACPDAPLFQIGGFSYGRGRQTAAGINQAWLLAWPMNNYWNTNFRASQPGFVRFRYELAWFGFGSPAAAARFAAAVARPVVFHPVAASAGSQLTPLLPGDLDADITVVMLKLAADGHGLVIGLHNHADQPRPVTPTSLGAASGRLVRLSTLEEPVEQLPAGQPVFIPGRSAILLYVDPGHPPQPKKRKPTL
jgi:hypothetical protein